VLYILCAVPMFHTVLSTICSQAFLLHREIRSLDFRNPEKSYVYLFWVGTLEHWNKLISKTYRKPNVDGGVL